MGDVRDFLEKQAEKGELDFALESPKGIVKKSEGGSRAPRPEEPPKESIDKWRKVAADPHVKEAIETLIDYIIGSGFSIKPRNIPYTESEQTDEDIAELKYLVETSRFETEAAEWIRRALIDGTGFLEIVWEDGEFKPRVLPTKKMKIITDEFGEITGYEMEKPGGSDPVPFDKYDVAILRFFVLPGEDFGHSLIEAAHEQADMLRDMEIDHARFIATKAYPPILWKLGTAESRWSESQIEGWLDEVEAVEPDSMLAAGHDVDYEMVGAATGAQSAGMSLGGTFEHLENRIAAGIGVPAFLLNMKAESGNGGMLANMPKFDRRVKRYQTIVRQSVESQVFRSIMGHPDPENFDGLIPEFDFAEHSSDEERLDTDEQIKLFNMGFLKREAFARRVGIDPEVEMPDEKELEEEIIPLLTALSGNGDAIANPDGGRPTDTGTGERSAGEEVQTRQNPERENEESRPQRSIDNE